MKKYILLISGFLLLLSDLSAQEVVRLTMREALDFALENNVNAKNARLEVLISKATIKEETSKGLPQINGNVDLTYNASIPVIFVPNEGPFAQPDIDSDVLPAQFGVKFQSGVAVTLNQMIFDGSYFVGLKAAKTLKALTEYDREKTEVDVIESVKKAYLGVLVSQEQLRLADANLRRTDTLLHETKALYEAGFAEKIDVSRIQVQRNNSFTQIQKSRSAYEVNMELLKVQMGLPAGYVLDLEEDLSHMDYGSEISELLDMERGRRVEVDQVNTNLQLVQLDLKNNQVQYMPKLTANLTYQRNGAGQSLGSTYDYRNWFTGAFVTANLSIPIFDGLAKSARIQKNRVQLKQLENQRTNLEDNIEVEIFQAKSNLRNEVNNFQVQKENLELAREVYDVSKIKYSEGIGSNLEVVEADAALVEAEINYLSSLYDGLITKVDLEKALGLLRSSN